MKKYWIAFFLLISCSACRIFPNAQKQNYTIVPDDRAKIVSGIINRSLIENDTAFAWFKENMQWGEADESAVAAIQKNASKFSFVIVMGTWCHDSNNLIPKFFRLLDKAGYPSSKILLIAVDRTKKAYHNAEAPYNITNTPTFIVLQKGKEVGRVTEYGKHGEMEKELGEIIAGL
jgi:thiol-disulfide isomerase/thioredoxin